MLQDIFFFVGSCLLIAGYYLYLTRRTRHTPDSSVHALNAKIRTRWIDMIKDNGKMEILAIQTLRNSVMAASFMATTAILLIIGTLNLGEKIGHWAQYWHPALIANSVSAEIWHIKLAFLILNFAIAFYFFSMSIRFFNHVGYMIALICDRSVDLELQKQTRAYLNRAGSYYRYGTRAFFFSFPIIMWFFGSYFLIPATLGLIVGLYLLDRVPVLD